MASSIVKPALNSPTNGFRVRCHDYDCPPPADADALDAYEPGTVLDPLDREVVELLAEIAAWERSRP